MPDEAPSGFAYHVIRPQGREGLAFRILLPGDMASTEPPSKGTDFSKPTELEALLLAVASYAAIIFTVAARPAYPDGSVAEWLAYLCREQGLDHDEVKEVRAGSYRGAGCDAIVMAHDGTTPMRARIVLLEEGGRLFSLTALSVVQLWGSVEGMFDTIFRSFELAEDRGQAAPIMPPTTREVTAPEGMTEESGELPGSRFAELVLAADASSLDPDHEVNARIRDNGAGLTVRVLSLDDELKRAVVGAGAIQATFRVPYGWHVIDDGRRALVFDAAGRIQVHLDRRPGAPDEILGMALAEYAQSQTGFEHMRLRIGSMECLGLRGLRFGDEVLDQAFVVRESGGGGMAIVARVTATGEDLVRGLNLAGDILASMTAMEETPQPQEEDGPGWWREARALEAAGEIERAEGVIEQAIDHLGVNASKAELSRLRMRRLLAAGDSMGALEAFRRAERWITFYAACATSGGEGTALSRERDEFRGALVSELGYDPDTAGSPR